MFVIRDMDGTKGRDEMRPKARATASPRPPGPDASATLFPAWCSGFMVWCLVSRVQSLVFGVWFPGFRFQGLESFSGLLVSTFQ